MKSFAPLILAALLAPAVVECVGDKIKVWENGDLVNYGYDCQAVRGQIALQAEGSEIEFRKVELTPITTLTE